jgi:transcriptional regulator with XRE-family HTH domain
MVLLRRELGDVLREKRQGQGRTLREVSAEASCSLGYLSEVERGEKEASSELLASICRALDIPLSQMLSDVADRVSLSEAANAQMTTVLHEGLATPISHGEVVRGTPGRRTVVPAA